MRSSPAALAGQGRARSTRGAPRPSARATYLRSQAEPPAQGSYAPGPFPPVARWGADPGDTLAASTAVALQGQRAAAERLDEVIDDVLDQLRLLDARLGEAVARMLELSARAEAAAAVPELSSGIESLVTDLEALRLAVEETHALEILGSPMTVATAVPEGWDQPG